MLRIEDYYTDAPSAGIITMLEKPEIVNRLFTGKMKKEEAAFVSDNKPVMEKWRDIMVAVDLVLRVLSCFFANWLYYRFSMNSIRRLKKADRKEADIKAAGGVKPINMVLVMLIKYGVIVVLYMCYEMITAMRDFSTL